MSTIVEGNQAAVGGRVIHSTHRLLISCPQQPKQAMCRGYKECGYLYNTFVMCITTSNGSTSRDTKRVVDNTTTAHFHVYQRCLLFWKADQHQIARIVSS